jgi:small conductance mechanosensitive channel
LLPTTSVFDDPAPKVLVSELADSSVNLTLRAWSKSGDHWGIHFDTIENVKKAFDANGISIPFPQQDIHIHEHKN